MKIIKAITFGILGGLIYAIISFVLLSPYLRGNVGAIISWGIQGLLFSVSYLILSFILTKFKISKEFLKNLVIGALSGLFSCSLNVIVTLSNFYEGSEKPNVSIAPELIQSLEYELILYIIGSLFLGTFIGFLIGQKNTLTENGP